VQTNLQQVDVNKFTFQLEDAEAINHIVVFLLGTIPFQAGFAATVHLLWPNKDWQLLGMLSNEKSSAIFRLKAAAGVTRPAGQQLHTNDMAMDGPSQSSSSISSTSSATSTCANPITATLGISIEPIDTVMAQINNKSTAFTSATSFSQTSNALVPLNNNSTTTSASPDSVAAVAQKVMNHLYNHVTSFATAVLPQGSNVLVPTAGPGSAATVLASNNGPESSYLPVKAFNDWYQNVVRKAKADPLFLTRE
ncbi:hypothetical protein BGZ83_000549, partial [Gryganskiella cystojenkinii]